MCDYNITFFFNNIDLYFVPKLMLSYFFHQKIISLDIFLLSKLFFFFYRMLRCNLYSLYHVSKLCKTIYSKQNRNQTKELIQQVSINK